MNSLEFTERGTSRFKVEKDGDLYTLISETGMMVLTGKEYGGVLQVLNMWWDNNCEKGDYSCFGTMFRLPQVDLRGLDFGYELKVNNHSMNLPERTIHGLHAVALAFEEINSNITGEGYDE